MSAHATTHAAHRRHPIVMPLRHHRGDGFRPEQERCNPSGVLESRADHLGWID
jgi:hypothetical protein